MTKYLEKTGRTEEEAIAAALEELGLDRDDVSLEIISRAKTGFLGIGASKAVIRVSYECDDEPEAAAVEEEKKTAVPPPAPIEKEKKTSVTSPAPEKAKETSLPENVPAAPVDEDPFHSEIRAFLGGLLERMGVSAEMEFSRRDNGGVSVNLTGKSMGAIIGRRGETLDAIQHLTNYAVNRGNDKRTHISVDAEGYRSKREDSLTALAKKMAEKAIKYKRPMALEPMNSYERHVIHAALQDYEGVSTSSTGSEPNRRVVVSYVKSDAPPTSNKPKSREWA